MSDESAPAPKPEPKPAPGVQEPPKTFSAEYVTELRAENATWRNKLRDIEGRFTTAEQAVAEAKAEAERRIAETTAAANSRIIMAELKAQALEAGIVDLDGLKLADLSSVQLNDAGELEGGAELISGLKESKPYLFAITGAQSGTTSQTAKPPAARDAKPKLATDMSDEEYAAFKRTVLARR
jgi:hypothetical protein